MPEASPATLRSRYRAHAIVAFAVLLPLAISLGISFAVTPEQIESGAVVVAPACHFKRVFGRPCPTCGMTRAFSALSHGRLDDASRYNRGAILLYSLWWLGASTAAAVALRAALRTRALPRSPLTTPEETSP